MFKTTKMWSIKLQIKIMGSHLCKHKNMKSNLRKILILFAKLIPVTMCVLVLIKAIENLPRSSNIVYKSIWIRKLNV